MIMDGVGIVDAMFYFLGMIIGVKMSHLTGTNNFTIFFISCVTLMIKGLLLGLLSRFSFQKSISHRWNQIFHDSSDNEVQELSEEEKRDDQYYRSCNLSDLKLIALEKGVQLESLHMADDHHDVKGEVSTRLP